MSMLSLFFTDIVDVILIGLVLGAGLPALFSVGIASYAWGAGGDAERQHGDGPEPSHPVGRAIGVACFGVVLLVIAVGISTIVASGFGYHVDYSHVVPTFVKK